MDDAYARELLARERARIEGARGTLAPDEDGAPDPADAADAGETLYQEELAESQSERLREELDAIERAEERLAMGTYGLSVHSGEPIPDARLEAIPWAERTAEEQASFEAGGA